MRRFNAIDRGRKTAIIGHGEISEVTRARHPSFWRRFLLVVSAFLAFPLGAGALDLDLKVEPGLALPLSSPQTQRFDAGGAGTLKGLVGLEGGYVSIAAGLTFVGLPAQSGYESSSAGTAWAPSLGIRLQLPRESEEMRLKNPHDHETFFGAKPWVDADVLYVRTGGLDRAGLAAAAGLSFPIGESRSFALGPFVRYFHIFQANDAGDDSRDANLLIIGASLEFGTRLVRPSPVEIVTPLACPSAVPCPAPTCPDAATCPECAACAVPAVGDRDGDEVPDDVDQCPDLRGPASNHGCPVFERIVVKPDKLELKEKIQFAWNTGVIEPVSFPTLNEVAKALRDNKGLRVAVEGHSSSEGGDEHNQILSKERAEAVLEYLTSHGVPKSRLVSKGFSSSMPLESNATASGREANRRVEFVVHFVILKEGSAQ